MFQPIHADPPPDQVRRITFVPFPTDGRCVLIDEPGDLALPSGEVLDGEHYLLDTVLRVPLQTDNQRTLEPAYLRGTTPGRLAGSAGRVGVGAGPAAHHRGDRRRRNVPGRRLRQRAADGVGGGLAVSPTVSTYRRHWPNSPGTGYPGGPAASGSVTP